MDTGHLSITAQGVDRVIEQENLTLRRDRLLVERNPETPPSPANGNGHQRLNAGTYALPYETQ